MKFYKVLGLCLVFLVAFLRADDERNVEQKAADAVKEDAQAVADTVTEAREKVGETYDAAKEKVKEGTEPARQSLAKHGSEIKEGAQEIKHESAKNFSQVGDRFSEGGSKLKEGAGETLGAIKDTAVVGAKTVGEHVSNVASGVAGVASDAGSAVAGAAVAAKDAVVDMANQTKNAIVVTVTVAKDYVGKTIIGAGEAITSDQALKERQGGATIDPTLATTNKPLKVKRDTDLGVPSAVEGPKHHSLHRVGDVSSSEELEKPVVVGTPHQDDVMLARPARYARL